MALPPWLEELRREEILDRVRDDSRTRGRDLLGAPAERIFTEVIGGGQAEFDAPWEGASARGRVVLTPDDCALLYAYKNQLGHLEELIVAFTKLFERSSIQDPIVIDVGCGPFTAGLALAAVLGDGVPFDYIGHDRSASMLRLGERLAQGAARRGALPARQRQWAQDLDAVSWVRAPGFRPVVIVVSYLLASRTFDPTRSIAQLERVLARLGAGPVIVLYTNSAKPGPNRRFPELQAALEAAGFTLWVNEHGLITTSRYAGRPLRYALFHRPQATTLDLGEP